MGSEVWAGIGGLGVVGDALVEDGGVAFEIDANGVFGVGDSIAGAFLHECSAAKGDDLVGFGEDLLDDIAFGFAEGGFAVLFPDLGDGGVIEFFTGKVVGVDEILPELVGEDIADGCFSGSAVTDEDDIHGG